MITDRLISGCLIVLKASKIQSCEMFFFISSKNSATGNLKILITLENCLSWIVTYTSVLCQHNMTNLNSLRNTRFIPSVYIKSKIITIKCQKYDL